jgi:diguanylate cyclase (GGDEF)-like protein
MKSPISPNIQDLLRSLFDEYASEHQGATWESFREAIEDGVVLWRHLDLKTAMKITGQPVRPAATDTSCRLIRTKNLQDIIDRVCSTTMEDGLTGLFNRRYFEHRLAQELQRSKREQCCCSVMLADIDDFKRINDTCGHRAGDDVLKLIAGILKNGLRSTDDVTSRIGGEEFAVILPSTNTYGAYIAAERLRKHVQQASIQAAHIVAQVTVSIGIATFDPRRGLRPLAELVELADRALYEAKAAGKNAVRAHYDSSPLPDETGVTRREKDDLLR